MYMNLQPLIPSSPQYHSMAVSLAVLSPSTLQRIEGLIHSSLFQRSFSEKYETLEKLIDSRDLNDEYLKTEACPYAVLEGLRQGKFTDIQAATLLHYHAVLKDPRVDKVSYHDLTQPENWKLLETSFANQDRLARFRVEVEKLPESEKGFFLVPNFERGKPESVTLLKAVMASQFGRKEVLPLVYFLEKYGKEKVLWSLSKEQKRIIPSLGLVQAYLDASFPGGSIKLRPRLGVSPWQFIRQNGLNNERDVFVPGPGIENPQKIDGFPYEYLFDIVVHDALFHAFIQACMPFACRYACIQAGDDLRGDLSFFSDKRIVARTLAWILTDLDFPVAVKANRVGMEIQPEDFRGDIKDSLAGIRDITKEIVTDSEKQVAENRIIERIAFHYQEFFKQLPQKSA